MAGCHGAGYCQDEDSLGEDEEVPDLEADDPPELGGELGAVPQLQPADHVPHRHVQQQRVVVVREHCIDTV